MALVGLALGVVILTSPVHAHSALKESDPVDGQTMRGAIDHVQLVFWSPFTDPQIDLTSPGGSKIVGATTQLDDVTARFEMDPISEEGVYRVAYQILSRDGDSSIGGIEFAINLNPGRPLGVARIAIALVGVIVLVAVWMASRDRNRGPSGL